VKPINFTCYFPENTNDQVQAHQRHFRPHALDRRFRGVANCCADMAGCKDGADCCDHGDKAKGGDHVGHAMPNMK